jgi:hypothetical protein
MIANVLLTWLSAKGSGTWTRYRAALEELLESEASDDKNESLDPEPSSGGFPLYHQLRQNFERLGHAEFFRPNFPNGWRIAPPTLVSLSDESRAVGIFCGARTDELISDVSAFSSELRVESTKQSNCPDRIQVIAEDQEALKQLAESTGLYFQQNTPLMILAAIPPVDHSQVRRSVELPFGSDWDVSRFSATTLGWKTVTVQNVRKSTFGLFRFNTPFQPQYYLRLRAGSYRISVQVGKYIVLNKARRRVLAYDGNNKALQLPVSCRPPLLVDRALILCSGLAPTLEAGSLNYQNINKDIAMIASALLRQEI